MKKDRLIKGFKKLAFAIIFAFMGPFVIQQAFQNKEHGLYIYVLTLGLIIAGSSIALGFIGISNIVSSLDNNFKKKTDS